MLFSSTTLDFWWSIQTFFGTFCSKKSEFGPSLSKSDLNRVHCILAQKIVWYEKKYAWKSLNGHNSPVRSSPRLNTEYTGAAIKALHCNVPMSVGHEFLNYETFISIVNSVLKWTFHQTKISLENFSPKKLFIQKTFHTKKLFVRKNFLSKNTFCQKKLFVRQKIVSKKKGRQIFGQTDKHMLDF